MFKHIVIEYEDDFVYVLSEDGEFTTEIFSSETKDGVIAADILSSFFVDMFGSSVTTIKINQDYYE